LPKAKPPDFSRGFSVVQKTKFDKNESLNYEPLLPYYIPDVIYFPGFKHY
jgi:hypothetical protein